MIFKYIIDEVAGVQLLEAAVWYEEKRAGLGSDLILCFEEGIETICHLPFTILGRALPASAVI